MTYTILLLALHFNLLGAFKLAPVSVESLINKADLIARVSPTRNPSVVIVREIIWSSIKFPGKAIKLAADPPHLTNSVKESYNAVYGDSIVFLYKDKRDTRALAAMKGADHHIVLHSNKSECIERGLQYDTPPVLIVGIANT
jgi:hypothetical protein